jgi:hypothetical protein
VFLLAVVVLITLAACQPESAEPVAPAEPLPAAVPVEVAVANAVPAENNSTFDQRSFAGTFTGTVAGAQVALTLAADGSFVLSQTPAGSRDASTSDGTWTVEADDRQVRLDPNSKAEADRLFAISSNDRIAPLASDGTPLPASELVRQ